MGESEGAARIILCGTDNVPSGDEVYFIGYSDMVDGYRHAWREDSRFRSRLRRGRNFGHPPDPRCPECAARREATTEGAFEAKP